MTDLDSLTWPPNPPEDVTALERLPKTHPHTYARTIAEVQRWGVPIGRCRYCERTLDEATARRGRNNRSRGNSIERDVAAKLGMRRVGMYGGPDDIRGAMFAGQVKSGTAYPEKLHRWLKEVPVNADETAILVITDAPGPGHQRRGLVILDLEDWRNLHGPVTP